MVEAGWGLDMQRTVCSQANYLLCISVDSEFLCCSADQAEPRTVRDKDFPTSHQLTTPWQPASSAIVGIIVSKKKKKLKNN